MVDRIDDLTVDNADGRVTITPSDTAAVRDLTPDVAWRLGTILRMHALKAGHLVKRGER